MAFNYTVAKAIEDSKTNSGISASIVTAILGELAKSVTHADAHMKSEDFWTAQRKDKNSNPVGSTAAVDDHLKSAYKKRSAHSMFDSSVSSVEAITAALNSPTGTSALTSLLAETDKGIDIYSRTAVKTMGSTKQFNRKKLGDGTVIMDKVDAEYVVVCLRKVDTNLLAFASAYPVEKTDVTKLENVGDDWYQRQGEKTVIHAFKPIEPIVNW